MLFLFIVANAGKIVAFNVLLIQEGSAGFTLRQVFMALLLIGVLYPLIYIIGSRTVMIAAYLLQALYIAAGITYYFYFHTWLHVMQASALLSEVMSTAGNSAVRPDPAVLISILDMPFFFLLLYKTRRKPKPVKRERLAALLVIIASLLAFSISEAINYSNDSALINLVNNTYSGETPIVERYGTLTADLVSVWQNGSGRLLEKQLEYGSERTFSATGQTSPNLIVIQVESMDSAIVNKKYQGAYVTPFLHSLTKTAVYYPFMLSYHKGGGTSDSEFSILNSVEPLDCYPALKLSNYSYPNSLLTRLDKGGYAALAFHGNKGSFYNRDIAFAKLGFTKFFDMAETGLKENGWGIPDGDMFSFTFKKLNDLKQPFLAYVITMSSHEPFNSVANYYTNSMFDGIMDANIKNYFNSMNYVDKSLQAFVSEVRAIYGNTYIFITGDHTPNIDGEEYRQASFTIDNCYFEFVPLIIITPDGKIYNENLRAASFLDMAPTILKASGVSCSILTDGSDLLEPEEKAGDIPYRGNNYDRALLFKKVAEVLPSSIF